MESQDDRKIDAERMYKTVDLMRVHDVARKTICRWMNEFGAPLGIYPGVDVLGSKWIALLEVMGKARAERRAVRYA